MNWLYLLKAKRKSRYKIGITTSPSNRVKAIGRAVSCRLIFCVPVFFARYWEGLLHRKYKHLNRTMSGSGKTEWFYFWLPFRPVFWMLLFFAMEWGLIILIIFML